MTRILFICHGNICRSAAAEMIMRHLAAQAGLEKKIAAASAAVSSEELGHDVYPPMKRVLLAHGVPCPPHSARQTTRQEYERWDRIVVMDHQNLRDAMRIYGGDRQNKISLLMDWTGQTGHDVRDPWYTRDFEAAFADIQQGCAALLSQLCKNILPD